MNSIRKRLTYANVMSSIAVFLVLGGGAAFATGKLGKNSVGNKQLKSKAVSEAKLRDGAVTAAKIADGAVITAKLADGSVVTGKIVNAAITGDKLADGSVSALKLANSAVTTPKIADDAVTSAKVPEFGLSNQDIGVLFAQVNANGTLANSSGGVTSAKLNPGFYEVNYGRDISSCAFVTTQGEAAVGAAGGAITGNTDRENNVNATFTTMRDAAGVAADNAFQQVVVC